MPNWVTNKIEFGVENEVSAQEIFDTVCTNGNLDFNTLVPTPLHIYQGDLSSDDKKDFDKNTWHVWNCKNWGTKWNACSPEKFQYEDGKASIEFDTAWSVPYSIIIAFGNKFKIPFVLKYFDEGHNFWGVETWGPHENHNGFTKRISKRDSLPEDRNALCIELKGYNPEDEEDYII